VLKITRNPYQRGAAACAFLALILSIAGASAATVPVLGVGLVFALVAVRKRDQYPR
jgi:hypothetical protein